MNELIATFTGKMSPKGSAFGDVEIANENSFVPLAGTAADFDVHISVDFRYSAEESRKSSRVGDLMKDKTEDEKEGKVHGLKI